MVLRQLKHNRVNGMYLLDQGSEGQIVALGFQVVQAAAVSLPITSTHASQASELQGSDGSGGCSMRR